MVHGMILLWAGAIVDIPNGWILCDGNNGSPDLRNRFIVGAGDTYDPDDTGGAVDHTHTFTGDGHAHDIAAGVGMQGGANWDDLTAPAQAVGTTDVGGSLPPYYALAFIMKL